MGDVVKFKMCEELLPYFTLGYGLLQGMVAAKAAACMLVGVTKKATPGWH
jgi:alpha-D-ribose 1-methylphosphonate 5-triphosphate synthase subunit PhnI